MENSIKGGGVSEARFSIRKKKCFKTLQMAQNMKKSNKIFFSIMTPHHLPGLTHITCADMSTN